LILSAGVSRGLKDLVPVVLRRLGVKDVFHEIEQKPGRPFWFGQTATGQLVFGLPGNPVATLMNLRRFVIPTLALWEGQAQGLQQVLLADDREAGAVERMLPVCLEGGTSEPFRAHVKAMQGSGDFASLQGTDGFICLPPNRDRWQQGTQVAFFDWSPSYARR
jgi:molybdopterin molybdotransferase